MLEVKRIPTLKRAIAKIRPLKSRMDEITTEHPDVKIVRRHRAAEAAVKNLERLKDRGLIDNRATIVR
ncbi:MAG: hypothetical protein ACFFFC_06615 [Candidatus Thorarchaeota archaeon]